MGAIVKELKEKIVAAGGDTTGVQTVSEALDKLPAGGGLPEWAFVVTFTHQGAELTCDKTYDELNTAWLDGKVPYLVNAYAEEDGSIATPLPPVECRFTNMTDVLAITAIGVSDMTFYHERVGATVKVNLSVTTYAVTIENETSEIRATISG